MDDLHDRGFGVWAFDFAGYGGSERRLAFRLAAAGQSAAHRKPAGSLPASSTIFWPAPAVRLVFDAAADFLSEGKSP
jgi:hypothetical protein